MTSLSNTTKMLNRMNFFSKLDENTLQALQQKLRFVTYPTGEELCCEGERGYSMFILESGSVAVIKKDQDGSPIEINTLHAGQVAGEMSLLGDMDRSATLKAKEDTGAWVLDRDEFHNIFGTHAALGKALLSALSGHLDQGNSIVAKLLSRDLGPYADVAKIAFFDTKPYMKAAFEKANNGRYNIDYLEANLSSETVSLAAGHPIVCVFVNDNADEEVVKGLKAMGVELIALRCAGYNNVALAACEAQGISLVRVPAYSPNAVAEHAVALMLSLNRKTFRAHSRVREGNFALNGLVGFDMCQKTAGIVGTGKIGKCAAKILAGFGCRVVAYDTFKDEAFAESIGMEYLELDELFAQCDIISLHVPLIPETHYMINAASIEKMKDGVMIVNTGRGALIETIALIDGLKSGKIGYAGLDVYEEEDDYFFEDLSNEIIEDDVLARLTTFNNVIVTSHQAFLTEDALAAIASTTFNNIDEFLAGKRGSDLTNSVEV